MTIKPKILKIIKNYLFITFKKSTINPLKQKAYHNIQKNNKIFSISQIHKNFSHFLQLNSLFSYHFSLIYLDIIIKIFLIRKHNQNLFQFFDFHMNFHKILLSKFSLFYSRRIKISKSIFTTINHFMFRVLTRHICNVRPYWCLKKSRLLSAAILFIFFSMFGCVLFYFDFGVERMVNKWWYGTCCETFGLMFLLAVSERRVLLNVLCEKLCFGLFCERKWWKTINWRI